MKNIKSILLGLFTIVAFTTANAQIKNAKTESVKVYGNCGMCKKTIENAANEKGVSQVVWDVKTSMLAMTYNSAKTNSEAILKKIASAGYDSDAFRADDAKYNNLHSCCQYVRPDAKSAKASETKPNCVDPHAGHKH
jgi:copper chaperone CopZ